MKKNLTFVICMLLLFPFVASIGQKIEASDDTHRLLMDAAKEIMTSANTCALITLDEDGAPRVRAMDPFDPDSDLMVWFGTNSKSRKVDQIRNDPRVTLYYLDSDESGYVMIHGEAELINDPIEKANRWKEEWAAFYPDRTNDYLLIKVAPKWMEVLSISRGIVSVTNTWEPPSIMFEPEN